MLISHSAWCFLDIAWRQLRGQPMAPLEAITGLTIPPPGVPAVAVRGRWQRPGGRTRERFMEEPAMPIKLRLDDVLPADAADHLTPVQRRARAAALRASLLARQRRHVEAALAFSEALTLDPAIDLTEAPQFWELERAAHRAAADAYEAVGRTRDAMTLRGRIELRFRPRLLRSA